jgi:hypothetical protein
MIIDIEGIAEKYGVDLRKVALLLFPDNNFPVVALRRLADNGGDMRASQMFAFAKLCGCRVDDLYALTEQWQHITQDGLHIFRYRNAVVTLDMSTGVSLLKINGEERLRAVMHERMVPLHTYLANLNALVKQHGIDLGEEE